MILSTVKVYENNSSAKSQMSGAPLENWSYLQDVTGLLDMVSGSNTNDAIMSVVRDSTHYLIIDPYVDVLRRDMKVVDDEDNVYIVTYADDPGGQHHHVELYLRYVEGEKGDDLG